MSGVMQRSASTTLRDLLDAVKQCQIRYANRTELATANDSSVIRLCAMWETTFAHGLKSNASLLRNVTDLVLSSAGAIGTASQRDAEADTFWDFAFPNLTSHEKERFLSLRHVWSDRGKGRALIRAALNERSLERYILMWLNAPNLDKCYEKWALMQDAESANLLPSIAGGLSSILFAINVDSQELNVVSALTKHQRTEPMIVVPRPSLAKSTAAHRRHLVSFDEPADEESSSISSVSSATSARKSLSSKCLKYPSSVTAVINSATEPSFPVKVEPLPSIDRQSSVTVAAELPSVIQYETNHRTSVTSTHTSSSGELDTTQDESIEFGVGNDFYSSDVFAIEDDFNDNLPEAQTTSESASTRSSISCSMAKQQQQIDDAAKLRDQLNYMVDRCAQLENRVAELSLENYRLRGSARGPSGLTYFSVSVPRVLMQNADGARRYYTYQVHIIPSHGGDEWTILRRYNEFYKLHRRYQKENFAVKTLDFPPKKRFGNMDANFVEQRRQRLQVYLRHLMAVLPEVAQCTTRDQLESAFPFLT